METAGPVLTTTKVRSAWDENPCYQICRPEAIYFTGNRVSAATVKELSRNQKLTLFSSSRL